MKLSIIIIIMMIIVIILIDNIASTLPYLSVSLSPHFYYVLWYLPVITEMQLGSSYSPVSYMSLITIIDNLRSNMVYLV